MKKRRGMLISKIIGRFKMLTAKHVNLLNNTIGERFWQLNYHDRVIRDNDKYNRISDYIYYNPQNWAQDRNNFEIIENWLCGKISST